MGAVSVPAASQVPAPQETHTTSRRQLVAKHGEQKV
jgi:hypothetical protein